MEKLLANTSYSSWPKILLSKTSSFSDFFFYFLSSLKFVDRNEKEKIKIQNLSKEPEEEEEEDEGTVTNGDIQIVMDRLGIACNPDDVKLQESYKAGELSRLFEEEPSLEELKQAFDVFDENKDGFIDAIELQAVLRRLGLLKEGTKVEDCRNMVMAVTKDCGDDAKICFNAFVTFMEECFC